MLNASALNSATAVDVVLSSWLGSDSLTGGPSANDTLVLTGSSATDNLTTGTFTGFEDITLSGNSDTLTLNGASVAVKVAGTSEVAILGNGTDTVTGGSGNTVTLGGGTDTVSFASGINTVNAVVGGPDPSLLLSDNLTGGSGTDTLAITGNGGTFNLTSLAAFTGFEDVTLSGDGDLLGLSTGTLSVSVTDSAPVTGNTVTLNTGKTSLTFNGGSNTVNAVSGGANPTLLVLDSLKGAGSDTLALTGGGTVDFNSLAGFSGFSTITEGGSGNYS